jgi:hypothetical protein
MKRVITTNSREIITTATETEKEVIIKNVKIPKKIITKINENTILVSWWIFEKILKKGG